jgi:hypothetical protein
MTSTLLPGGELTEVTCQRNISNNFSAGNQDFVYSIGAPNVFVPSQSYFIIDLTLTAGSATGSRQPLVEDEVALALDAGSCLYNNAYMRMGGQDVSSIVNFLPQSSIIRKRLTKTGAWLDKVGGSAYVLQSSFQERINLTAYDGDFDVNNLDYINVGDGLLLPTIAIDAAGLVTGVNTLFTTAVQVGDIIVVAGYNLEVSVVTNDTSMNVNVTPALAAFPVPATSNFEVAKKSQENPSVGNNRLFIVWQPPIGFFEYAQPLGAGDYRISLNPNSDYKKSAVQTAISKEVGSAAGQFDLAINDVKLYVATYKHMMPSQITNMGLMEVLTQTKTLEGNTEQFQFTVPPSTVGLAFFVQTNLTSSDSRFPPTKFSAENNEQDQIDSYQITYSNVTKPQTRWSGILQETGAYPGQLNTNTLQQRYHDTFTEANLINNPGGSQDIKDWVNDGQFVYHNFIRDSQNRSTQVQFSITKQGAYSGNTKLYLVAFYRRQIEVTSSDGLITSVRSLDV